MDENFLSVEGLGIRVENRWLVRDLDLHVAPGEIVLITGPNGAGKSTLLKALAGERALDRGVRKTSLIPTEMAILSQLEDVYFPLPLSLHDVIEIGLERPVKTEEACSLGLLTQFHLGLAWNTASGGERKRALINQLLLKEPRLIFLDEPFNHLDRQSQSSIETALSRRLGDGSRAAVLVSHKRPEGLATWGCRVRELMLGNESQGVTQR